MRTAVPDAHGAGNEAMQRSKLPGPDPSRSFGAVAAAGSAINVNENRDGLDAVGLDQTRRVRQLACDATIQRVARGKTNVPERRESVLVCAPPRAVSECGALAASPEPSPVGSVARAVATEQNAASARPVTRVADPCARRFSVGGSRSNALATHLEVERPAPAVVSGIADPTPANTVAAGVGVRPSLSADVGDFMATSTESERSGFACVGPSFALNLHTMLYHAISQA